MANTSNPRTPLLSEIVPVCAGLVAMLLSGACHANRPEGEIAGLLVVLPHASEVQRQANQVTYRVAEAYPGAASLEAIDEGLSRQGCRATSEDPFNEPPGLIRRTWEQVDQKGGGKRMVWMGAWQCDRGDVVTFTMSVAEPGAHPGWPLGVAGAYISASQVRAVRSRTRATS